MRFLSGWHCKKKTFFPFSQSTSQCFLQTNFTPLCKMKRLMTQNTSEMQPQNMPFAQHHSDSGRSGTSGFQSHMTSLKATRGQNMVQKKPFKPWCSSSQLCLCLSKFARLMDQVTGQKSAWLMECIGDKMSK